MNNILVTGCNGQLGSELRELAPIFPEYNFLFTDVSHLDILKHIDVKDFIIKNEINTIINCAAYTAVDKAEQEFELSNKINNLAVNNLAVIAKEFKIKLIHISTDYIFDGTNHKPYNETDKTNPKSVYGKTKLNGELAIKKINPPHSIIIRTSWVYSKFGNNFVKTMIQMAESKDEISIVSDQVGSPTNAADLANAILDILPKIKNKNVDVFHYSNEGVCSWYDFAKSIFEIKGISVKVNPVSGIQYPTPAKRPSYSVLNKTKIKIKFSLVIPHWNDSLKFFFKNNSF